MCTIDKNVKLYPVVSSLVTCSTKRNNSSSNIEYKILFCFVLSSSSFFFLKGMRRGPFNSDALFFIVMSHKLHAPKELFFTVFTGKPFTSGVFEHVRLQVTFIMVFIWTSCYFTVPPLLGMGFQAVQQIFLRLSSFGPKFLFGIVKIFSIWIFNDIRKMQVSLTGFWFACFMFGSLFVFG